MKPLATALVAGTLLLGGCALPFGASNVGPATLGGFFPAAKDAHWAYELARVETPNATPSRSVFSIEIENVTKTNDNAAILYRSEYNGFSEVQPSLPTKLTKEKAFVYPTGGSSMVTDENIEQIPLALKKDLSWTYKAGTSSIEVKAVDEPEVTVPAGKFKTVHLTYTNKTEGDKVIKESWLADGVGMVKGVFNGTATSTIELSSYHL